MANKICGYDIIEELGKGAFGKVYKVKDKNNVYAVKEYSTDFGSGEGIPTSALREIDILTRINHTNVIKLEKVHLTEKCEVCAIYEYADNDLEKYIDNGLQDKDILRIFFELACGLKELHDNNIIHTDLKPENCLIKDGVAKISDVDCLISSIDEGYAARAVSTLWWRAPELLSGEKFFTKKIDIWGLGLILANMYMKRPLVGADTEKGMLERIETLIVKYRQGVYNENTQKYLYEGLYKKVPEDVLPLMFSMLEIDPEKRIDIDVVLNHPVLDDFDCKITKDIFYSIDKTIGREFKNHDYIDCQEDRSKLIYLMYQIYKLKNIKGKNYDILFTSIDIFDRTYPYQEVYHSIDKEIIYVMSYSWVVTCLWIACKLHIVSPPDPVDFSSLLNEHKNFRNARKTMQLEIDPDDLIRFECIILKKLKFQVYHTTLYSLYPEHKKKILNYLMIQPSPIDVMLCDGVDKERKEIRC